MTTVDSDRTDDEAFSSSVVLEQTAAAPETLLASPDQVTQAEITQEIIDLHADAERRLAAGEKVPATLYDFPPYRSSILRHPTKNPRLVDPETIELYSPAFGQRDVAAIESDLTLQHTGEPQGERITVSGRLLDSYGRPLRNQLIEIWQANAAGPLHPPARPAPRPARPELHRRRSHRDRTTTGEYFFTTIKPGPYPWKNHVNAWRPAHIHFSVFGSAFTQRIITQMYFPGDPLFALDPIYNTIRSQKDRDRLIGAYNHDLTVPEFSMGYEWDIVVDGPDATWFEPEGDH